VFVLQNKVKLLHKLSHGLLNNSTGSVKFYGVPS